MFIGTIPPASNRATWSESYELTDAETGEYIDISDADEITVEVRDPQSQSVVLSATLGDGVELIDSGEEGVFQWRFEASDMRALSAKTYEIGCVIEQDDDEVQLLIGTLPVLDGIVA